VLVAHACNPATWEAEIWRLQFQASLGIRETPSPKQSWTGSMAQAVERLICKCEALSSNPNPTKRGKKKRIVFKPVFVFIAVLSSCQEECGFHSRGLCKL
jgi:hypothetical protein